LFSTPRHFMGMANKHQISKPDYKVGAGEKAMTQRVP